jgi:hypothetical protein
MVVIKLNCYGGFQESLLLFITQLHILDDEATIFFNESC